jgi:hypothetical protein
MGAERFDRIVAIPKRGGYHPVAVADKLPPPDLIGEDKSSATSSVERRGTSSVDITDAGNGLGDHTTGHGRFPWHHYLPPSIHEEDLRDQHEAQ